MHVARQFQNEEYCTLINQSINQFQTQPTYYRNPTLQDTPQSQRRSRDDSDVRQRLDDIESQLLRMENKLNSDMEVLLKVIN